MRATYWLIIACIAASLITWNITNTEFERWLPYFVFSEQNLLQGRIWTLITALFIHSDIIHLGSNMVFLFVFGNTLEDIFRDQRPLIAFLFGGITSFLVSTAYYPANTIMIGASGAIFTLSAVVVLTNPLQFSFFFMMPLGLISVIYFLYNAFAVYIGLPGNIAYIAHVSGFILGIPLGIVWSEHWKKNMIITIALAILYFGIQIVLQQWLS
jgi:membrane associated rhomboid family serine protease